MKLSAKAQYACIAALELARHFDSGDLLQIRRIAEEHGIPSRFLVQILLQLKSAGLVSSTRGAAGGYRLQQPPEEITLGAIIDVIEGQPFPTASAGDTSPLATTLLEVCRQVTQAEKDILDGMSLADLIARSQQREPMYYI